MVAAEDRFMQWVRDAHAMEEQAETMLSGMSGRIENYPDVKAQIDKHLEETRDQARKLRSFLEGARAGRRP